MLLLTLVIMGVGTAAIGLLPSYDAIGVWAPVLLVALRVLQGIGVGGEYGGAVLLAVEYAPAERRGFFGSFAHIGVPGGLLLASGAFSLASLLPDEAFLAWGWRACFLVSVVLLAIGAYIRLSVMETPAFARVQERKEVSADAAARPARRAAAAAAARHGHPLHRGLHLQLLLGLPAGLRRDQPRAAAVAGARRRRWSARRSASCWCRSPAPLSDRVGRKPVFRVGAWLALVFAFPVGRARADRRPRGRLRGVRGRARRCSTATIYGPLAAFWSELFDTRYRYTALEHALPDLRRRGLRPDPADRRLAGRPRRRARCGWSPATTWSSPSISLRLPRTSCPRPGAADLDVRVARQAPQHRREPVTAGAEAAGPAAGQPPSAAETTSRAASCTSARWSGPRNDSA